MYNGSEEHRANLAKARETLVKHKAECPHCTKLFTKGNISKHMQACINKKVCPVCETEFKPKKKGQICCSHGCANSFFRSGSDHPNWREEAYRTTCFHHHDKRCVVCGEENIVEVHHLDENHDNNSPDNLIPLCPTHHAYWHSRFKYLVEDKIKEYITIWVREKSDLPDLDSGEVGAVPAIQTN